VPHRAHSHSPAHAHAHAAATPAEKLEWARGVCRAAGLRRTPARELVLDFLARHPHPTTLAVVSGEKAIAESCDPATVFRILQKLEEIGAVRRLWLHERAPYYVLLSPHDHHDYVLCTGCGRVEALPLECPVSALEKVVEDKLGFAAVHHELGFYGLCPACQKKPGRAAGKPKRCC